MAKGSILGVIKGKLGNAVMYKVANSANKNRQGWREYQAEVANPKTVAQAAQRLKMTPAVNFYRALKDEILNHSWQGVKYGGRSYAKFMKLVMANGFEGSFPFVPKGFSDFVPGNYPLSRGSVAGISISNISLVDSISNVNFSENLFPDLPSMSFEEWVNEAIQKSGFLVKGDQITVVAVRLNNTTGVFTPVVRRIILDASKYENGASGIDVFALCGLYFLEGVCIFLPIGDDDPADGYGDIVAAGVIVSRPDVSQTSGIVTWQRSNADLYIDASKFSQYFTQEAYDRALASYQGSQVDPTSAWYLNQGTTSPKEGGETPVAPTHFFQITNKTLKAGTLFTNVNPDADIKVISAIDPIQGVEYLVADIIDGGGSSWSVKGMVAAVADQTHLGITAQAATTATTAGTAIERKNPNIILHRTFQAMVSSRGAVYAGIVFKETTYTA